MSKKSKDKEILQEWAQKRHSLIPTPPLTIQIRLRNTAQATAECNREERNGAVVTRELKICV